MSTLVLTTLVLTTAFNFVMNFIDRDIVAITVNTEYTLTTRNVYASPLEDIESILAKLQNLYNNLI